MAEKLTRPSTQIELPRYDEHWEETLKQQLFEEELKLKQLIDEGKYQAEEAEGWVHHHREDKEWDVPITETIKYFDPELSYELTGYRPITMDKGLDFDPTPFQEVGKTFIKTGRYTEYPAGGKLHRMF